MRSQRPRNLKPILEDKFLSAFRQYLSDNDRRNLIKKLRDIEDFEKERGKYKDNEGLWFRFDSSETVCYTVGEVLNDLKNVTNKAFILQSMKIAIKNKNMEIYYN